MDSKPRCVQHECFDEVIIGSSPLMLIQAYLLAKTGRKVCLIERNAELGGAWQAAKIKPFVSKKEATKDDLVEVACHIIEFFPNVYDFLEKVSTVPFVPLSEQPIRVYKGWRIPYFDRVVCLLTTVRLCVGYFFSWARRAITKKGEEESFINFKKKLFYHLRYQLSSIFGKIQMKGPKYGYVDFLRKLSSRCRSAGVEILVDGVVQIKRLNNRWVVSMASSSQVYTKNIHCTTSTNLRFVSQDELIAQPVKLANRFAVVVDVQTKDIVASYTYIAFWRDNVVSRI